MSFDFDTFIIVPPTGARFDDPDMQAEIESELCRRFPDCHFTMDSNSTERDSDTFTVIIVGTSEGRETQDEAVEHKPTEEELQQMAQMLRGSVSMRIGMFLNTTYPPAKGRLLH